MIEELPTNEDRARRASDLLARYNIEHNGKDGDLETSAGDLLADILHLADWQEWEPRDRFIDRGKMHHHAESTGIEPEPATIPPPANIIGDSQALGSIRAILSGVEWSPDTLDEIADVVRATGRKIADIGEEVGPDGDIRPNPEPDTPPLADPTPCLRAGHTVVAYWKEDTAGYVHWAGDEADGWPEIYDTEALESGPTEQATCRTCSIELDPEGLDV